MMAAQSIQSDPVEAFRSALLDNGLLPGEVVADEVLRRCPTTEKPQSKNGWYVLYLDPPAGAFGDWQTGLDETWSLNGEPLPHDEMARIRKEIEMRRAERERQKAEQHRTKAVEAQRYLANLPLTTKANPYLTRKRVKPCVGLLADVDALIIPVLNPNDDRPMSFQRITPDSGKKFMPGAKVSGGYFAIKGAGGPILIAEGIATALSLHEATGLTALVAFSAGNMEAVASMARERYRERKIIVCGDNDAKTAERSGRNPGVESAIKAAQAVNGLVAVPESPGDFNDLHVSDGLEAVKVVVDAARPPKPFEVQAEAAGDWPEPMPLVVDEKAEPYPVDALPGTIGEAVAEVTGFVQCPVALTACSALSAVSTVTAGLVDVQRAEKLVGPVGLFLLAVADSGERKSTLDTFFTKIIREWEAEEEGVAEPELMAHRAAIEAWEAKKAGIVNAIREASKTGKDTRKLESRLEDLETEKPEKPKVPRLLIGDATSEALTYRLAHSWPVGGMLSAEAGVVFGGHAMGRDSIMRNLATLNTLWDGQPLSVDRRTTESYTVRSVRLSLGLAVQLETVRQFIDGSRGLVRGIGFIARFLLAWPESTQGLRMFREPPKHWPALGKFNRRMVDLLNISLPLDDFGQLSPWKLCLSREAREIWAAFHDSVETELAPNGDMADAKDVASKAGDNAARLSALFHVFGNGPSGEIGPDCIKASARIVAWHLFEARKFLNQLAAPAEVSNAVLLDGWLLERCRQERTNVVAVNNIQKFGPNRTRRKKDLDGALVELEEAGRVRIGVDGRKRMLEINPALLRG